MGPSSATTVGFRCCLRVDCAKGTFVRSDLPGVLRTWISVGLSLEERPPELPRLYESDREGGTMPRSVRDCAQGYAPFLHQLIDEMDSWILRRVVSVSVFDADSLQVRVSIDFDLTESQCAEEYLERVKNGTLPALVLPLGLYPSPFVAFDLRDGGENRLSLLTGPTRCELRNQIIGIEKDDWVEGFIRDGELAIAHVPLEYGIDRRVIHYAYMTKWSISRIPYCYDLPRSHEKEKTAWNRARTQWELAWRPAKVTMPLRHPHLCSTFHIEFQAPDGIRVYGADIFEETNRGFGACRNSTEGDNSTTKHLEGLPPRSAHVTHVFDEEKRAEKGVGKEAKKGSKMGFVAWLGLDRRGFPATVLFLTVINFLSIITVILLRWLANPIFNDIENPNPAALVTTMLFTATVSFAYLQLPGEHGLARSLYKPLRWILVSSATSLLFTAILVAMKVLGSWGWLGILSCIFALVSFLCLVAAIAIYHRSNGAWIKKWVDAHCELEQYGRYVAVPPASGMQK
jgi:hypothetical protein